MNKTKIDNQTIAHILLDLRQKHHLSQEQLAQTLGVTRQAVSRWEMGISVPNIHTLLLISEQFHVPIDTMLKKPDASAENQNKIQNPAKRTPFIFMTITGIFLLCVLPFLGNGNNSNIWISMVVICRFLSLYFRIPTVHSSGIIHCPDLCRDL